MDWLILILGVPAILIPLVLLFGFAGCAPSAVSCTDDRDCPTGTQCFDNSCVVVGQPDSPPLPPSPPDSLTANALDDHSVSLTWTEADPAITDISFEIERTREAGVQVVFPVQANLSPTGAASEAASATDASLDLQEGVTFIYRVRAVLGEQHSDFSPSDGISATVFPAAPVNLVATAASINQIDLSWNNASAIATEFSLEHRVPGGAFAEIFRTAGTTLSDPGLGEGTPHEYRVFAIVTADHDGGVENNQPQDVKSAASAIASATTLAFTAAFTAPPGTLTTDQAGNEGSCVVLRLNRTLLTAGGTQVRIVLRGSTTGSLTLDKVAISQPAATANSDRYDAAADLTDVASGVTIPQNTSPRTVGPVNYTLDPTQDLLVAFDISNTPGEGNLRFGALTGAESFTNPATAEASVPDRTKAYLGNFPNVLYLVEKIEVL